MESGITIVLIIIILVFWYKIIVITSWCISIFAIDDVAGEITVCDENTALVAVSMNDPVYQEGSIKSKIEKQWSNYVCSI